MRKIVLLILAVGLANLTHAQDLPTNPEPESAMYVVLHQTFM